MLLIEMVSDSLRVWLNGAGTYGLTTTAKYRDPSAHMDIYVGVDTDNATATERLVLAVNGVRVTGFQTVNYPPLNFKLNNGIGTAEYIGGFGGVGGDLIADGYFSECFRADGASGISASSFGEFNAYGVWVPKKYTGSYGTNGFYLDFKDGTSLTTLGYDKSGNSNNWSLNNISLTAGVTYDWMDDTPSNNFAVLNPLDTRDAAISNGNLTATGGTSNTTTGSTIVMTAGKLIADMHIGTVSGGTPGFGVYPEVSLSGQNIYVGQVVDSWGMYTSGSANGDIYTSGAMVNNAVFTYAAGDLVVCALDLDAGKGWFGRYAAPTLTWANIGAGAGDPATGANPSFTFTANTPLKFAVRSDPTCVANVNFGQRPFAYTPPTGFKALCTKNLTSVDVIESGIFTGNANANGPFVWCNGTPETLTINSNAVTWGTHADRLANGFKLRTNSSSYNAAGSNSWTATILSPEKKSAFRNQRAKGNP